MLNSLVLAPTTIPDAAPLDYVEAAARAGYRLVGMRVNPSPGMSFHPIAGNRPLVAELKNRLDDAGIQVLDVYSFYLTPTVEVAGFEPALALAAEFGASYAVTMGADPDWSRLCDNFARIAGIAERYGLTCAVEPAVIRPLANFAQAQRMIAEAGCANVAIVVDPLNFARAGDRVSQLQEADPRLLRYAQICDGIIGPGEPNPETLGRMSPNRRTLLGQGDVPLDDILDALPRGIPLSIELPPVEGSRLDTVQWATLVREDAERYLQRYEARG